MQFANCVALVAVEFTTLINNLRLSASAETGIVLNLFLKFEQKGTLCSYKIVLLKNKKCTQ